MKNLLANDFSKVVNENTVASEELIRFLIHMFNSEESLLDASLIRSSEVVNYLTRLISQQLYGHYQLIVEFGVRSLTTQGSPDSIHYSALDIYYDEQKCIVFVADHYHGKEYHSYRDCYQQLDLPIQFIVAGGSIYQADKTHCPFFTLQHLLLTAHDSELQQQLFDLARNQEKKFIPMPWYDLSPRYNFQMQSFSGLLHYIDYQKEKEGASLEEECQILKAHHMDIYLSQTLETNEDSKIQNRGIEQVTATFAKKATDALEKYSDSELINICYSGCYSAIATILQQSLLVAHFIFSNQSVIHLICHRSSILSKSQEKQPNELLYLIFKNKVLLEFMSMGKISPSQLFELLINRTSKEIKLKKQVLKLVYDNLSYLEQGYDRYYNSQKLMFDRQKLLFEAQKLMFEPQELLFEPQELLFEPQELLFLKNSALLEIPQISELFFTGKINVNYLDALRKDLVLKISFEGKSSDECKIYLDEVYNSRSPCSVARMFSPQTVGKSLPSLDSLPDFTDVPSIFCGK